MDMEPAALDFRKMMQGGELREMEWAPPTETAPLFFAWQDPPEEYGPWQWAGESGRAASRFTADAFTDALEKDHPCFFFRCHPVKNLRVPHSISP